MFDEPRNDPIYGDVVYNFRYMTLSELERMSPKDHQYKHGYFCTTFIIDTRRCMRYLMDSLKARGVKFINKKLNNLENFIQNEDYQIVFNCFALGNQAFTNDPKIVPIRGQMIRIEAPWIKHFYYTDDNCYIIPNIDTICLGGTRQYNNANTQVDDKTSKEIFERCKRICPSIEVI
jgi:glycine/D-amino acid oxidase-like deaminating enzyme